MKLKSQSNSRLGHRNVSYDEKKQSYVVSIYRKGKFFVAYLNTLDEAIDVRDRAYAFYEKHGRLPKKSDLSLTVRKRRVLKERTYLKQTFVCSICKREISYYDKDCINSFIENGNICGYCSREKNLDSSLDARYIYASKTISGNDVYRVKLDKGRRSISRSFRSLDEATAYRDQILSFYKENRRLPNDRELETVFGTKLVNRRRAKIDDTDDLRNIRHDRKSNRYFVCVIRDRIRFNTSFSSLDEARLARDIFLLEYEESGRVTKVGEVRARMRELGKLN